MARKGPEAGGGSRERSFTPEELKALEQKALEAGKKFLDETPDDQRQYFRDVVSKELEGEVSNPDVLKLMIDRVKEQLLPEAPKEIEDKNSLPAKPERKPKKSREKKGGKNREKREPVLDVPGEVIRIFEQGQGARAAMEKIQELVAAQTDDLKKGTEIFLNVARLAKTHFENKPDGDVSQDVLDAVSAVVAEAEKQYEQEHDTPDAENSADAVKEAIIDILIERRKDKVKDPSKILEEIFAYADTLPLSDEERAVRVIDALNLYQDRYMKQEGKNTPLAIITGLTHKVEKMLEDIRNPKTEDSEEDPFEQAKKDSERNPKPRVELLPQEEGEDEPSAEEESYDEALSDIQQDAEDAEDFDDARKLIDKGIRRWSKKASGLDTDALREKLIENAANFFFESEKEKLGEEEARKLRFERVQGAALKLNQQTEKANNDLMDAVAKNSPEIAAEVEAEQRKPISLNQAELDKNLQPNEGNDPKDAEDAGGAKKPEVSAASNQSNDVDVSDALPELNKPYKKEGYANVDEFLVEQMGSEEAWNKKLDEWAGKSSKTESSKAEKMSDVRSAAFDAGLSDEDIDFLEWGNSEGASQYLTPADEARLKKLKERVETSSSKDGNKSEKKDASGKQADDLRAEFIKRGIENVTDEEIAAFKKRQNNETLSPEEQKHIDSIASKAKEANLRQEYLAKARANGYEPVQADIDGYVRAEMNPESLKDLSPEDLAYIRENIYSKLDTKNPALGGQENIAEMREQNEKLRKLREGIDRSKQTTFERAKGLGEAFEQKAREWGDWYRAQPWYKKLGLAATSIGLGFGASFVGGSMGSLMGAGALALNASMRTLSAFSTYSFVEGALRGKHLDEDGNDTRGGFRKGVHKAMAGTLAFLNASGLTGKAIAKVGSPVFGSLKQWILEKMGTGVGGGVEDVGGGIGKGAKEVGKGLGKVVQGEGGGALERGAEAAGKGVKKAFGASGLEDAAKEAKKIAKGGLESGGAKLAKKAAESFEPGSAGFDKQLHGAQDQVEKLLKQLGDGKASRITLDRTYEDPAKMLKQAKDLIKETRKAMAAGDIETARGLAEKAAGIVRSDIPDSLEGLPRAEEVVDSSAGLRDAVRSQAVEAATRAEAPAPDMSDVDAMKFGGAAQEISEQAIQAKNEKIAESLGAVQWDRVKDLSADKVLVEGRRRWWSGMTVVGRAARLMQRVMSETGVRPEAGESVDHFMSRAYEQAS